MKHVSHQPRRWLKLHIDIERFLMIWQLSRQTFRAFVSNRLIYGIQVDSPPTFIVGCGHSGTSILLAILGAHPRIQAIPFESGIARSQRRWLFNTALRKFDRIAVAFGKNRWIEKTPRHIRNIEQILAWQPDAKMILIVRDGRDVAFSMQKRNGDLMRSIERWIKDNEGSRAYWNHPNMHVMKYEDLIVDFRGTITDILTFLGEDYDATVENYHQKERKWYADTTAKPDTLSRSDHNQHRNWQINQPLFDARGKWHQLTAEEVSMLEAKAGYLLVELGYSLQNIGEDSI